MKTLENKIALVTGATRGVGKGVAIGLGEAGATVYITGRTLEPLPTSTMPGSLLETQADVEAAGGRCIPVLVDHGDDRQVHALFERIEQEQGGQLDLLVNNVYAGVTALRETYGQCFWQSEPSLWDQVNQVGLRSHYVSSVLAARLMTRRRQGLICTISSWGALYYLFGVAYGVGKTACDRLAQDMALELRSYNVASLSLWPGIVGTEQIQQFMANVENPPATSAIASGYNWETPLLTGRAIAALAADPKVMRSSGQVRVVAELAQQYGLWDETGQRPASLRSLRFMLPYVFPALRPLSPWVPDLKIPWSILRWSVHSFARSSSSRA